MDPRERHYCRQLLKALEKKVQNHMLLHRVARGLRKRLLFMINCGLHWAECALADKTDKPLMYPPIFIIGAPRSGSTLLYQVLTDYFEVGYLSNLHSCFYGAPSFAERVFHPLRYRKPSDYSSYYGRTYGWTAPSECGEFWYRFFRRTPSYVPLNEVDDKHLRRLRGVVRSLVLSFNKPILFKNLYCSVRVQPIIKALPEALFIVVRRNLIDNSQSLLEGRKSVNGTYEKWFSLEPPEVSQLKLLPPHIQVVEQVRSIYRLIDEEATVVGKSRFFEIEYESFCADTLSIISGIKDFINSHGTKLNIRGEVRKKFSVDRQIKVDKELYKKICDYIEQAAELQR